MSLKFSGWAISHIHFLLVYSKKMYFWIFFCTTNIASCMLTKAENNYLNSSGSGKGYSSVQNKFSKWEGWGMRKSRVAFKWNRGELLSRTHTDVICCVPYVRSLEWDLIAGRISSYYFLLIYINLLEKKMYKSFHFDKLCPPAVRLFEVRIVPV